MSRRIAAVCLILTVAAVGPAHGQGLLQRIRIATNGIPDKPKIPKGPPDTAASHGLAEGSGATGWIDRDGTFHRFDPDPNKPGDPLSGDEYLLYALGIGVVATSPIWIPALLAGDDLHRPGYFPGHPYALSDSHYMVVGGHAPDNAERTIFDPTYLRSWSVRAAGEDGNTLAGTNRISGRMSLDTASRFGVSTNWDYLTEQAAGRVDDMLLGDLMLTYRVVQADSFLVTMGLGAKGLFDRYDTRFGVNMSYGVDVFPIDPVVISASGEVGTLHDAVTMRTRVSAGVVYKHAEAFVGYDWFRVGGADVHGPMAGLRLWW